MEQAWSGVGMDELRVLAPGAWARLTRVLIANRGQAGFRHGPPNRSCALLRYRPYGAATFSVQGPIFPQSFGPIPKQVTWDAESGRVEPVKMILSRCEIHRGCIIEVFFGEKAGGRIPWPDPDLKPDAERDFPGLVPIDLKHFPKDQNVKAREAISALTVQVAELREDNKKLLDQLVAAGFRNDELAQAPRPTRR